MVIFLKYINYETEKKFKTWCLTFANYTKGFEKKGFTEIIKFFLSTEGQDSYKRWKIEETQKDPLG